MGGVPCDMTHYSIGLAVAGRKAVIVGGGQVARRKAATLRECDAVVVVVSPAICPGLARMKGVACVVRAYRKTDLRGACLVIAATDSRAVNRRVHDDAMAAGIPVNVVDQPEESSFIVPATARRGDITVTVSTGGGSPALARGLRIALEDEVLPPFAEQLALLKTMRPLVLASDLGAAERRGLFRRMAGDEVRRALMKRGRDAAARLMSRMLAQCSEKPRKSSQ